MIKQWLLKFSLTFLEAPSWDTAHRSRLVKRFGRRQTNRLNTFPESNTFAINSLEFDQSNVISMFFSCYEILLFSNKRKKNIWEEVQFTLIVVMDDELFHFKYLLLRSNSVIVLSTDNNHKFISAQMINTVGSSQHKLIRNYGTTTPLTEGISIFQPNSCLWRWFANYSVTIFLQFCSYLPAKGKLLVEEWLHWWYGQYAH
jgi:hypothetical protein